MHSLCNFYSDCSSRNILINVLGTAFFNETHDEKITLHTGSLLTFECA